MIRAEKISVIKDEVILDEISLSLADGTVTGIIGKSGAGKSTLLRALAGLEILNNGFVYFENEKLKGPNIKLIPGYDDIQLVHQGFELEPFHTVAENVKEKILHLRKEDRDVEVNNLLQLVELDHLKSKQARFISGGEQQRLAIARALATKPKVLLLDEPFVHVDHRLRLKLMNFLLEINEKEKTTILLVSHDGEEMMGFVEFIIHIENGKIVRKAKALELYNLPKDKAEAELLGLINHVQIDGTTKLFRPHEYIEGGQIDIDFVRSLNTGREFYNYFRTAIGEEIVLTSSMSLEKLKSISIAKK